MKMQESVKHSLGVFANFCKKIDSQALVMVTISCVTALMGYFATGGLNLSLVGGSDVVNRILIALMFLMIPHAVLDTYYPQLAVAAAWAATFIWAFLTGLILFGQLSWPFFLLGFLGFLVLSVLNLIGVLLKW